MSNASTYNVPSKVRNVERESCLGCAYYLGGAQCGASLEYECGAGGFESWEPKRVFPNIFALTQYREKYMSTVSFHARISGQEYEVEWGIRQRL